jgi:hypothetical protein
MRNYFQYTFYKRALLFWLAAIALNAMVVGVCNHYNRPVLAWIAGIGCASFFAAYCIGNFLRWMDYRQNRK